jgi:hypothetical protein
MGDAERMPPFDQIDNRRVFIDLSGGRQEIVDNSVPAIVAIESICQPTGKSLRLAPLLIPLWRDETPPPQIGEVLSKP